MHRLPLDLTLLLLLLAIATTNTISSAFSVLDWSASLLTSTSLSSSSSCTSWTSFTALQPGRVYPACIVINHEHAGDTAAAMFDDSGKLGISSGLWAAYPIQGSVGPFSLSLDTSGVLSILDGTGWRVWSSVDSSTIPDNRYPGIPISNTDWTLRIHNNDLAVVLRDSFVFWSAANGQAVPESVPVGTNPLPVNKYVVSDTDDSFIINQLDGRLCAYRGTFPDSSNKFMCIPDW